MTTQPTSYFSSERDGLVTAIITPFKNNDSFEIDYKGLQRMIYGQYKAGVTWILFGGSTGEPHCLSEDEWKELIRFGVSWCHQFGMKAIVNTGTNSTEKSIEKTKYAVSVKSDACMLVCPYYNKPTKRMMINHFSHICQQFPEIGFMIYNVPSRTGVDLTVDTAAVICTQNRNIIALKEATDDIEKYKELRAKLPSTVGLYTGEDLLFYEAISQCGFHGVVSVASNIIPKPMIEVHEAYKKRCNEQIDQERKSGIIKFMDIISLECNPVAVKYAASKVYKTSFYVRQPLLEATISTQDTINKAFEILPACVTAAENCEIENQEDVRINK